MDLPPVPYEAVDQYFDVKGRCLLSW